MPRRRSEEVQPPASPCGARACAAVVSRHWETARPGNPFRMLAQEGRRVAAGSGRRLDFLSFLRSMRSAPSTVRAGGQSPVAGPCRRTPRGGRGRLSTLKSHCFNSTRQFGYRRGTRPPVLRRGSGRVGKQRRQHFASSPAGSDAKRFSSKGALGVTPRLVVHDCN